MLSRLFRLDDGLGIEDPGFLSVRLCYHAHVVATFFLTLFAIHNFVTDDPFRGWITASGLFFTTSAVIHYRKTANQAVLQNAVLAVLLVVLVPIAIFGKNEHYTLIWTLFFPVFAIMAKGRNTGLAITILFYLVAFPVAYLGIGVWQEGLWTLKSFLRYSLASLFMTSLIYYFKYIYDSVFNMLLHHIRTERDLSSKLELLSETDHLTGLRNRRSFEKDFYRELNRAKRDDKYLSFIILDVDFFKRYNDTYGHEMGDIALKRVAEVVQQTMSRASDCVFRLGGEEFGAVVTSDSDGAAALLAEKLCAGIEALNIAHESSEISSKRLTVSIGVCERRAEEIGGIVDLYRFADEALYAAKENGRNGVQVYSGEVA